jgi:hypothetical protein
MHLFTSRVGRAAQHSTHTKDYYLGHACEMLSSRGWHPGCHPHHLRDRLLAPIVPIIIES